MDANDYARWMASQREPQHDLTIVYGLAGRAKPVHSDAATPFIYGIDRVTAEETVHYRTVRGYKRHIAELRKNVGRIIAETALQNGRTMIVYYGSAAIGPHSMPSFAIYPACEL